MKVQRYWPNTTTIKPFVTSKFASILPVSWMAISAFRMSVQNRPVSFLLNYVHVSFRSVGKWCSQKGKHETTEYKLVKAIIQKSLLRYIAYSVLPVWWGSCIYNTYVGTACRRGVKELHEGKEMVRLKVSDFKKISKRPRQVWQSRCFFAKERRTRGNVWEKSCHWQKKLKDVLF